MVMKNKDKFNFSDFTHSHYRELLKLSKKKYVNKLYTNFDKNENYVIWRHDIDISIDAALDTAKIEFEEGIKTTYFIHPHNEFYNLLEKETSRKVNEIISMGHEVGLHFDSHYYNIKNEEDLCVKLDFEKSFLEKLFNIKISVFSFHNTNEFVMSCDKWQYAGMINTYAKYFKEEVEYCSDSWGRWRFKRMDDVLNENHPRLHLLTHSEWWTEKIMSPIEKVKMYAKERMDFMIDYHVNHYQKYNIKIIDWE
jgi:hypothetical protein